MMAYVSDRIRVTLNERSTNQLQTVMNHLNTSNPTHAIQRLIGALYETLTPQHEEKINEIKRCPTPHH